MGVSRVCALLPLQSELRQRNSVKGGDVAVQGDELLISLEEKTKVRQTLCLVRVHDQRQSLLVFQQILLGR